MNTFTVSFRTPEGVAWEDEIVSLVVPGTRGCYGILANHAPMVGTVVAGIVRATKERPVLFVVGDGVLRIDRNRVDLLTESVQRAADVVDAEEKLDQYRAAAALPPAAVHDVEG